MIGALAFAFPACTFTACCQAGQTTMRPIVPGRKKNERWWLRSASKRQLKKHKKTNSYSRLLIVDIHHQRRKQQQQQQQKYAYKNVSTLRKARIPTTTTTIIIILCRGFCANVSPTNLQRQTHTLCGEPVEKPKSSIGIVELWSADVDHRYFTIKGYDCGFAR